MSEDNGDAWKMQRRSDARADDLTAFVRRWSQRKQAGSHAPSSSPSADGPSPIRPRAMEEAGAAPPPDLETLSEGSDFSAFLGPKVGEELRRLALRKLFHMPNFNIRDGLDDYDDDYRAMGIAASALGSAIHDRLAGSARQTRQSASATPSDPERHQGAEPPAVSDPDPEDESDEGPASA